MLKYLQKIHFQLKGLKKGIDNNAPLWATMPVTTAIINDSVQQVETLGQQMDALEAQLVQKMKEARKLEKQMMGVAMQVEKIAKGIHANEPAKLAEYNLKPRKKKEARPVPGKAIIQSVKNDTDGEGFIIKVQRAAHAEYYEWQRLEMLPAETTVVAQPPFPFFITTTKLFLLDNYVKRNHRYYYRVRAVNRAGAGAWSEPVSAVQ